jgi:hypothetical protein
MNLYIKFVFLLSAVLIFGAIMAGVVTNAEVDAFGFVHLTQAVAGVYLLACIGAWVVMRADRPEWSLVYVFAVSVVFLLLLVGGSRLGGRPIGGAALTLNKWTQVIELIVVVWGGWLSIRHRALLESLAPSGTK